MDSVSSYNSTTQIRSEIKRACEEWPQSREPLGNSTGVPLYCSSVMCRYGVGSGGSIDEALAPPRPGADCRLAAAPPLHTKRSFPGAPQHPTTQERFRPVISGFPAVCAVSWCLALKKKPLRRVGIRLSAVVCAHTTPADTIL